ncbi:MAG: hypothetical protein Q8O89_06855, partial [Nanoarchaeota archaeon]|nr:hypothetical protein [Nanoarchaeota archaeon]
SDVHGSTSAYKQLAAKREADIASAGPAAGGSSSGSLPAASGKGQVVSVGKGYMWVPPDAKAGNYHLIIYLHGTESNANAVVNFDDVAAVADKFVNKNSHVPFIIVGPETSGQYFDDFSANSVLKDAQAKLNSVSDGIKIDPSKVSLTGHSGAGCQGGLVKTGTIYSQKFYAMGLIDSCSKASRVSIIEPRSNRLLFIFGNFAHTVGSNDVAGQKKALGATTSMSCPSSSYQKIVQCYTDGGNHYAFDLGSGAEHWHTIETGMEQFLKLFFS